MNSFCSRTLASLKGRLFDISLNVSVPGSPWDPTLAWRGLGLKGGANRRGSQGPVLQEPQHQACHSLPCHSVSLGAQSPWADRPQLHRNLHANAVLFLAPRWPPRALLQPGCWQCPQ